MDEKDTLTSLIEFSRPIEELAAAVSLLPWDAETPIVVLQANHVTSILDRYALGSLDASKVEEWANLIECRKDIDYEAGLYEEMLQAIYVLANPTINGDLNTVLLKELRTLLCGQATSA